MQHNHLLARSSSASCHLETRHHPGGLLHRRTIHDPFLNRLRHRDPEDWSRLFQENWHRMRGYAKRMLGRKEDAEDCAQQAFTRLWTLICDGLERLEDGFILGAVRFEVLSLLKRRRRRDNRAKMVSLNQQASGVEGELELLDLIEATGLLAWEKALLREALASLTVEEKQVIIAVELEKRTYNEVVAHLGMTRDQVRYRRHTAWEKLSRFGRCGEGAGFGQ